MTNNMDEFEDQFDPADEPQKAKGGAKESLMDAWRNKPLFKLLIIMGVVGVAMAGALGAFSGSPAIETARIGKAPNLNEVPGGQASPFFVEQNKQANEQRVNQAMEQGGSAIPTPVGNNVDLSELTDKHRKDPLLEFRAETERLKQEMRAEQKQSAEQVQILQQQMMQKTQEVEDDSLAKAMQRQMQELMEGWVPRKMTSVQGAELPKDQMAAPGGPGLAQPVSGGAADAPVQPSVKTLVSAGSVNYAQLLTEANSDVPGPILVQILSGPLSGGRAIGRFQTMGDYLVLTFSLVSFKGKDYSINAMALDPDTTLGGMATEVDHRYFSRLVLPAAASFMSSFGSTLGSGSATTTSTDSGIIVEQAKQGYKDAAFAGLGQMGETMSQFFQSEAGQIKPLVRVAVGTPMGLFFLQPVKDETIDQQDQRRRSAQGSTFQELLAQGYQQGQTGIASPYGNVSGYGSSSTTYPYATGGTTTYPGTGYTGTASTTSTYNPYGQTNNRVQILAPGQSYNAGNTTIYSR